MIKDIIKILDKRFINEISEEGNYGSWNDDKSLFIVNDNELLSYVELEPEERKKYIDRVEQKINELINLNVLMDFDELGEISIVELLIYSIDKYSFARIFYKLYGTNELKYNLDKIILLSEILFNNKKISLNITKGLFNFLLKVYKKYMDKSEFNIDVIIEELDIRNNKFIFTDFEVLIYAISSSKNNYYIANLLDYFIKNVNLIDKKLFLDKLECNGNFEYIEDNADFISDTQKGVMLRNSYNRAIGNICYKDIKGKNMKKYISKNLDDGNIIYNKIYFKAGGIFADKVLIVQFTKLEYKILSLIKSYSESGGISKKSIIQVTKQTEGAFVEMLKNIRRKIKAKQFSDKVIIVYIGGSYKIDFK